jgi:putative transcriptional regulator
MLDQTGLTQIMILTEIFDGNEKPSEISRKIGITIQGVQYHTKIMKEKGLIDPNGKITENGFDFLYSGLSSFRDFVMESMFKLDNVLVWEAIAMEDLKEDSVVWLKMKDGYLYATSEKTGEASGIVIRNTPAGEIAGISQVKGIINMQLGTVSIIVIPDIENIKEIKEITEKVGSFLKSNPSGIIGVLGEEAMIVAKKMNILPGLEFAPLESAFEASNRGISTHVIISNRRFHFTLQTLRELQRKNPKTELKINYI